MDYEPLEDVTAPPMTQEEFRCRWGHEPDTERDFTVAEFEALGAEGADLLRVALTEAWEERIAASN